MNCSRTDCNTPAESLLSFEPGRGIAHLLPIADTRHGGGSWLLCAHHANTLVLPRSWILIDDRAATPALFAVPDLDAEATSSASNVRRASTTVAWESDQLELDEAQPVDPLESPEHTRPIWSAPSKPSGLDDVLTATTPLLQRAFAAAR